MTTSATNLSPNLSGNLDSAYGNVLLFGLPSAPGATTSTSHENVAIPVMNFTFYDALQNQKAGSDIYIRMNTSMDLQLANPYQEATGIFGSPNNSKSVFEGMGAFGGSFTEALTKQLIGGAAGVAGFVASAGQNAKSQTEFLIRQMFNTFQQLIYQGPQFRSFTPSFNMRPTSKAEADNMRNIIKRFKVASSTRVGTKITPTTETVAGGQGNDTSNITQGILDKLNLSSFTFGYPDMCKISLKLYEPGSKPDSTELKTLFTSNYCVITNVATTYGSQNKMVFFDGNPNPSEVTLSLTLREAVLYTAHDAVKETDPTSSFYIL